MLKINLKEDLLKFAIRQTFKNILSNFLKQKKEKKIDCYCLATLNALHKYFCLDYFFIYYSFMFFCHRHFFNMLNFLRCDKQSKKRLIIKQHQKQTKKFLK